MYKMILPYISTLNCKAFGFKPRNYFWILQFNRYPYYSRFIFVWNNAEKLSLQKTAQDFQISLAGILLVTCSKNKKKIQVFYFIK